MNLPQTLAQERVEEAHLVETERPAAADENVFDTLLTLKAFNDEDRKRGGAQHIYGLYDEEVYYLDRAVQILMTRPIHGQQVQIGVGPDGRAVMGADPLEAKTEEEWIAALNFQRKFGRNLDGAKKLAKKLKEKADSMNEDLYYAGYVRTIVKDDRLKVGQDPAAAAIPQMIGMFGAHAQSSRRISKPDTTLFLSMT